MLFYEIAESVQPSLEEEEEGYCSFGIHARQVGGDGKEIVIPDLFLDKETAERFVDFCNTLQLEEIHLKGVIEDLLTGDSKELCK